MKNCFVVLSLLTVSQVVSAHASSVSFAAHMVEHAHLQSTMITAFALFTIAALLVTIKKKHV